MEKKGSSERLSSIAGIWAYLMMFDDYENQEVDNKNDVDYFESMIADYLDYKSAVNLTGRKVA